MSNLHELVRFVDEVAADTRLTASHIAMLFALFRAQILNTFQKPFNISRSKVMEVSHIKSRTTYHKILSDLQAFGYIVYHPSFHPGRQSSITLIMTRATESFKTAA